MKRKLEKQSWLLVAAGSALLAGMVAQRGLETGWRAVYEDDPPADPWRSDSWSSALVWAGLSAVVIAAAQLSARHGAQVGWKKVTGRLPPTT